MYTNSGAVSNCLWVTVVGPGFPGGGGRRQSLSLGQKPIIWQDFCSL